jgi:hypothetical protein
MCLLRLNQTATKQTVGAKLPGCMSRINKAMGPSPELNAFFDGTTFAGSTPMVNSPSGEHGSVFMKITDHESASDHKLPNNCLPENEGRRTATSCWLVCGIFDN